MPLTPDDWTALSRLMDDDLPEAEAAAWRGRLAEPDVAEAWAALKGVAHDLDSLDDAAPPAALDHAVLAGAARPATTSWRWAPLAVAAAALAAWMSWPVPDPTVVAEADGLHAHGDVHVAVGDLDVHVRGHARIATEPRTGVVRGGGRPLQEEAMKSTLLGAAAGAALTVSVYEGTAWISGDGDHVVEVGAGEVHRVAAEAPAPTREIAIVPGRQRVVNTVERPSPPSADPADEVAALKEQLARAEARATFAEGQLATYRGDPIPWPSDLPEAWEADAFEARLREAVADLDGASVAAIDCDEFPCIASIHLDDVPDDPADLQSVHQQLVEQMEPDWFDGQEASALVSMGIEDRPEGRRGTLAVAFLPPDEDRALQTRLAHRVDALQDEVEPR